MPALDDATIAQLKAKHGETLVGVEARDGTVLVFRQPSRMEFDRWYDKREEKKIEASRELAQSCVVFPDTAALFATLEKQPGLLMCRNGFVDTLAELGGLVGAPEPKKL